MNKHSEPVVTIEDFRALLRRVRECESYLRLYHCERIEDETCWHRLFNEEQNVAAEQDPNAWKVLFPQLAMPTHPALQTSLPTAPAALAYRQLDEERRAALAGEDK